MLHTLVTATKRVGIGLIVLAMTTFFPVVTFADTASDAATCTPPSSSEPGVRVPTGSDAGMFTYDCDLSLWVSAHYTYNPATDTENPRDPQTYVYNDTTGLYDVDIWTYVASKGAYVLRTVSVSQPPAGATTVGGPTPLVKQSLPPVADTNTALPSGASTSGAPATNTTSQNLSNSLTSTATSGNALVFANTTGGNASSGNALALANVVNMLQSSGNAFGASGNAVTFVSNINGDVNGDILLDPALISSIQPASSDITLSNATNTDQAIHNTIDLGAQSGNATVDSNTNAGNATTGTATAVANVLNFLNSAVTAGQSFLGVININGSLNGDILMPPGFIDQLLASNVPTVAITSDAGLTNNTNQAINNAVTASATSGSATVDKNTNAGSATTGNANTHITAFNLTGSNIIGSNDLLVFVNVLGTWYGIIFNAPGATSAQIGGGITGDTTNNTTPALATTTNQTINNDINVSARSGDASVTKNTKAGNATSGDARAAVNLLNITDSSLSLANWFGILFINVFGAWNGSFGINTSAGDPIAAETTAGRGGGAPAPFTDTASASTPQLFHFVARTVGTPTGSAGSLIDSNQITTTPPSDNGVVLASHTHRTTAGASLPTTTDETHANFWFPAAGITLGIGMLLFERIRSHRHAH